MCCEMQEEAGHADIVAYGGSKADSGGNGEPSVLDDLSSSSPTGILETHAEEPLCCQTDVGTDQSDDHKDMKSESSVTVDVAGGEPALQTDGRDNDFCDDNKMTENQTIVEDISASCADISSGVSHMDIDVSKETADSTNPGTTFQFYSLIHRW